MRLVKSSIVVAALALVAAGCAPHRPGHPHHGEWHGSTAMMHHGCGPESCMYGSRCFSGGAVRSNDGACQECDAGKWVASSGCHGYGHDCGHGRDGCHECGGKMGKKHGPCGGKHHDHDHSPEGPAK